MIQSINDLTDLGGIYHVNFNKSKSRGFITADNSVLAKSWYVSYEFKLANNFDWGSTDYSGTRKFLSNVKVFRMWNPGDVQENFVVALLGWENSAQWVVEYIEPEQFRYVWSGYKEDLVKEKWHRFEFEYQESDPKTKNGSFKMWWNDVLVIDSGNIITRNTNLLKRPYIVGFENVWNEGSSNGDNDFHMRNVVIEPNLKREDAPTPSPVPPPTPEPSPVPQDDFRIWFKGFLGRLGDFLKNESL